jgi:hypothetical protein
MFQCHESLSPIDQEEPQEQQVVPDIQEDEEENHFVPQVSLSPPPKKKKNNPLTITIKSRVIIEDPFSSKEIDSIMCWWKTQLLKTLVEHRIKNYGRERVMKEMREEIKKRRKDTKREGGRRRRRRLERAKTVEKEVLKAMAIDFQQRRRRRRIGRNHKDGGD